MVPYTTFFMKYPKSEKKLSAMLYNGSLNAFLNEIDIILKHENGSRQKLSDYTWKSFLAMWLVKWIH